MWSVSSDKTCVVWSVKGGVPSCLEVLEGHASRIFACATDGGKFVWTGGWDKTIIAWNYFTRKFVGSMEAKHDDAISVLLWNGSVGMAREQLLISGSWDGKIVLWKQRSGSSSSLPLKMSKSVSDHWGEATTASSAPEEKSSSLESFGKVSYSCLCCLLGVVLMFFFQGLKLLSRSSSRNSLTTEGSQESPRGVMSLLTRKPSRADLGSSPTKPIVRTPSSSGSPLPSPRARMGSLIKGSDKEGSTKK